MSMFYCPRCKRLRDCEMEGYNEVSEKEGELEFICDDCMGDDDDD